MSIPEGLTQNEKYLKNPCGYGIKCAILALIIRFKDRGYLYMWTIEQSHLSIPIDNLWRPNFNNGLGFGKRNGSKV